MAKQGVFLFVFFFYSSIIGGQKVTLHNIPVSFRDCAELEAGNSPRVGKIIMSPTGEGVICFIRPARFLVALGEQASACPYPCFTS